MKSLKDILYNIDHKLVQGNADISVSQIHFDSRKVENEDVFVAVKGTQTDGHQYIQQVIEKGAAVVVCQEISTELPADCTFIQVENSALALGLMASNYFDNPSAKLKLIGITGTNGKTTSVTLLHRTFSHLGYMCGLISTILNKVGDREIHATHTTPDPVQLNKLLAEMVEEGCDFAFMEVSSHAIDQHRVAGLQFAGGIFSNLTRDHLDYHKSFKEYLQAKKQFFDMLPKEAFALTNSDDKNGMVMLQNCKAKKKTYSLRGMADYKCKIIESHFDGMQLLIDNQELWAQFIGSFNAYNLLAVYATAIELGAQAQEVLMALSGMQAVNGRFEYLKSNSGITAIVDYAHTPDALKNVLSTIDDIRTGNEKLITVVGCGGDRDKGKRPEMAKISADYSDKLVLTSDNPRTEDPEAILNDMQEGLNNTQAQKCLRISNRKEAIRTAVMLAQAGDIILVAGKGHETYQEINGVRHHFDDKEVLREIFEL